MVAKTQFQPPSNEFLEKLGYRFSKSLLSSYGGELPQGFLYGHTEVAITADDLKYVNPEAGATEYTYEEEDAILGKSMTDNPRVKKNFKRRRSVLQKNLLIK